MTVSGTSHIFVLPPVPPAVAVCTPLPGLALEVNAPANSVLLVSTFGGFQVNPQPPEPAPVGSTIDIKLRYNGVDAVVRRVSAYNVGNITVGYNGWSITQTLTVAGPRLIEVCAQFVQGSAAVVSSGAALPHIQGQLSVVIIKR